MNEKINTLVTRDLVDSEFALLLSKGGWRPALMPEYINNVIERILPAIRKEYPTADYFTIKKLVIKRMKELDPVLFKR